MSSVKIALLTELFNFVRLLLLMEFVFTGCNAVDVLRLLPFNSLCLELILDGERMIGIWFWLQCARFVWMTCVEWNERTWDHYQLRVLEDNWINESSSLDLKKKCLYSKVGCGWGNVLNLKRSFELKKLWSYLNRMKLFLQHTKHQSVFWLSMTIYQCSNDVISGSKWWLEKNDLKTRNVMEWFFFASWGSQVEGVAVSLQLGTDLPFWEVGGHRGLIFFSCIEVNFFASTQQPTCNRSIPELHCLYMTLSFAYYLASKLTFLHQQ